MIRSHVLGIQLSFQSVSNATMDNYKALIQFLTNEKGVDCEGESIATRICARYPKLYEFQ